MQRFKKLISLTLCALLFAAMLCGCSAKRTPSPLELCNDIISQNSLTDLTSLSGDKLESYFGFKNSNIKRFSVMISTSSERADTVAVFEVSNKEQRSAVITGVSKYAASLADSMQSVEAEYKKVSSLLIMELDDLIIFIICPDTKAVEQQLITLGAKAVY